MELADKATIIEEFWDTMSLDSVHKVIEANFGHPHRDFIGLNRSDLKSL